MYIIIAILLFGILIAAHEWGHFIAARLCGVTVHEFAIGMGPAIWQREGKKGTTFSLRALPIGGYCAMEGEEEESDDPHSLNHQGFWKKTFVFAAGALMNFIVGVAIIFLLFVSVTISFSGRSHSATLFDRRIFVFLGEFSLPMFLNHSYVRENMKRLFGNLLPQTGGIVSLYLFLVSLLGMLNFWLGKKILRLLKDRKKTEGGEKNC